MASGRTVPVKTSRISLPELPTANQSLMLSSCDERKNAERKYTFITIQHPHFTWNVSKQSKMTKAATTAEDAAHTHHTAETSAGATGDTSPLTCRLGHYLDERTRSSHRRQPGRAVRAARRLEDPLADARVAAWIRIFTFQCKTLHRSELRRQGGVLCVKSPG